MCRGGADILFVGRASCLRIVRVYLPAKLVKIYKVSSPPAAAPGRLERRYRALVLVRRGVSLVGAVIEFEGDFAKWVPSNKANAADCQSKVFIAANVARHGNLSIDNVCW